MVQKLLPGPFLKIKLNVRDERFPNSFPIRVVLDTHGRLPADSRLMQAEGEVAIVCNEDAMVPDGVQKWAHSGVQANLDEVHSLLAENGVNEVLVEAGSTVTGSYLAAGCWDEMILYVAPKLLGSKARPVADLNLERLCESVRGRVESVTHLGTDVRIVITNDVDQSEPKENFAKTP